MNDNERRGKDEMNLAVLPIAKLGRSDDRTTIEYYGTFSDKDGQKDMVWKVRAADGLGLPNELGERVLVALLYLASQDDFARRKMEFTTYQILKILGLADGSGNYRGVERAISQLAGILITSEDAWVQKGKDGKLRRAKVSKGFHIIDDYTLWNLEDGEERKSYIIWGERIWKSIKSGYIKNLDIDFYYGLKNPLSRRLYRFLDKMMHYQPYKSYTIDIFALANKLGMVVYEYPAHLKRPLAKAADELIAQRWLSGYEFIKTGNYNRIRFYREQLSVPTQPPLIENCDLNFGTDVSDPWLDMIAEMSPNVAKQLNDTRLVSIENGTATIQAKKGAEWLNNRLARQVLKELKLSGHEVEAVIFVE